MQKGDIVQIIDIRHDWYPCLLIVEEDKDWGILGYIAIPQRDEINMTVTANAYIRVEKSKISEPLGKANVIAE